MKVIKPQRLKKGDVIGVISPSAAIDAKFKRQFQRGVGFLEELGFMVKVGKNVFRRHFYSAGTAAERVADLHDMFLDPSVKAIIQSQGGETANEMLDLIDWKLISKHPKLFCGMSDGTVLLLSIFAKSGLVTLHGPDLLWGFGRGCRDYEKDSLINFLLSGEVGVVPPDPGHKVPAASINSSKRWRSWRGGCASGRLIGGNLGVICRLRGTAYEPDYKDAILFIEAVGVDVECLAMNFAYLHQAGIFAKVRGIVLGYCDQNVMKDKRSNRPVGEVLAEAASSYQFPILEIGEIGHNTANANLPIGVMASIDADRLVLSIDETGLR